MRGAYRPLPQIGKCVEFVRSRRCETLDHDYKIVTGCLRRVKLRARAAAKGVWKLRAPTGHPLTQAQQRIQRAGSVCASSPRAMACVRADRGAAAAMGAAVGIACGQVDDRVFLLPVAVAHDETDEAQHRHERRVRVLQFCGVDRGRRSRREFFAHRGAELRGPGKVLRVGASCGDGGFGGAVRVLADECRCGYGDESLRAASAASSAAAFSKAGCRRPRSPRRAFPSRGAFPVFLRPSGATCPP